MKLGYSTWGMPQVPIDDALAAIARLGYKGVEITVLPNYTTALERLDVAERRRIRRLLDLHGLELPAIAAHTSLLAEEPDTHAVNMARLKTAADLAAEWGREHPPALNTTSGGRRDAWEQSEALLVDRLGELAAYAGQRGVTVAIEPHVGAALDSPEKTLRLLKAVGSPFLKVNFDVSHFEAVGLPTAETVAALAPHSVHTHVKDTRGFHPDHEFLIPGEGTSITLRSSAPSARPATTATSPLRSASWCSAAPTMIPSPRLSSPTGRWRRRSRKRFQCDRIPSARWKSRFNGRRAKPMAEFTLPPLPYPEDALEPYIDKMTVQIHHDKHHGAYVTNLNAALKDYPNLQDRSIEDLLRGINEVPEAIRTAVRNHGGGHANHTMFWELMKPGGSKEPTGALAQAIQSTFGGVDALKAQINDAGLKRFGSGWTWLVADRSGKLQVLSTANQDSPFMDGLIPVLGNDVWEHAYYLKYQNRRADYLTAWWNVCNWDEVAKRYPR